MVAVYKILLIPTILGLLAAISSYMTSRERARYESSSQSHTRDA